jgi:hypothetical protein
MGKYGTTAVRAVELLQGGSRSAEAAWRIAAEAIFPDAPVSRAKVCPRETFLGLCQAGYLSGVPANACEHTDSSRNREYATTAAQLLESEPALVTTTRAELWPRVLGRTGADATKSHNQQMDVVMSLREHGLLVCDPAVAE